MNGVIPRVLLDTDIGGDCDDAGALALLNILALQGEIEVLSVTSTTSRQWAPACIKAINRYYGAAEIPIGMLKTPGFMNGPGEDVYAEKTARRFGYTKPLPAVEDAVRLMRRTLAGLSGKAFIAAIGPLRNLSQLLDSPPDDLSLLSGLELIQEKVDRVSIMGGTLNHPPSAEAFVEREFNIVGDVPSARNFIHRCPVPLVFIDLYLGENVKTGGRLTASGDMEHPIAFAYTAHGSLSRSSWDLITVLYTVRGLCGCWSASEPGMVNVTEDGRTLFVPDPQGRHIFLKERLPPDQVAEQIDSLLDFRPGPFVPCGAGAAARSCRTGQKGLAW